MVVSPIFLLDATLKISDNGRLKITFIRQRNKTSTSDVVMTTEYIIVVLPLRSNLVCLCKHHGNAHKQREDWADGGSKRSVSVRYEAPGKRRITRRYGGKFTFLSTACSSKTRTRLVLVGSTFVRTETSTVCI